MFDPNMFDPSNAVHVAELNSARFIRTVMSDVERTGKFRLDDMDLNTCDRTMWLIRLEPVIAALLRLGWITNERATPRTGEEKQATLRSVCEMIREARRIIATAEQPYVWNGVKFAATGPGASL